MRAVDTCTETTKGITTDDAVYNWIRGLLGVYISDKDFYDAFRKRFCTSISPAAFHKLVRRAEKQEEKVLDEEAERRAFHPAPYHMQHIKMHHSDYRRVCCVCGRRVYQAETVIGKDGKKTYCQDCYNKLIEMPRIRRKKTKKRKEGPKNKPSDIVVKR
ncbi:MAG: hypothetical protein PUC26_03460 [Eubacteriales bacterium]|nr:hypothetical protein [Eubacteriales bacterium]